MTDVRVPKVGMSTVEVDIVKVLVATGQRVGPGDPMFEASADKVDFSIEAGSAGTVVEVLAVEGQVCTVGEVVARLDEG